MNPLLRILYHFLKTIVRISLRIFYRHTVVEGRELLAVTGPAIVVSNHPSTLMDPFNAVARVKRIVFFLANASLFKHPVVDRILSTLYCIKIERYSDTGGKPLQNEEAFAQCREFLQKGGCLYVAPEGTSEAERKLRRIKTGTARIALSAEAANGFELGIKILPVGLNYSDPRYFRADIQVRAGEHIRVSDFREIFERDPWEAVERLTEAIHAALSRLIVDASDDEEEAELSVLEDLAQTETPLPFAQTVDRSQELLRRWRRFDGAKEPVQTYGRSLREHGLSDRVVAGWKPGPGFRLSLLAGALPAVYGYLNHLLPCGLPALIDRKFNRWPCYEATYKYVSGLVLAPLFYFLQIKLVAALTDLELWYAISLPLTGFFTDWYGRRWALWREERRLAKLAVNRADQFNELKSSRLSAETCLKTLHV